MSFFSFRRNKNAKAKTAHHLQSKPLFLSQPYVSNMLVKGHFKNVVELPKYVDYNEWLAFNTFEFFNYIQLFYTTVAGFCTPSTCPTMSAGQGVEYTWSDSQSKKIKLSAPQHIDYMVTNINSLLNNEAIFPTRGGCDFNPDFVDVVRGIFSHLFQLFAHLYHHHFSYIVELHEEAHVNSLFAHFISFVREFRLLDKKEMQPLQELIDIMMEHGSIN